MSRIPLLTFASLLPLVLGSCKEDGTTIVGTVDIRDFVAAVATSDDIVAEFHEGLPPQPAAGPDVTANGLSSMITGGTAIRTVEGGAEFTSIIVAVREAEGYWELLLPAGTSLLDVLVTLAQDIPDRTFTVRYAVAGNGGVGPYFEEFVSVLAVGTGDVQVSISWDSDADVDLYVVEPSGEVIYYGHRSSGTGGELDLDSNAACAGDNIRNENITWPDSEPPHGTYTVRVNLWADCGAATTNWVITVRRRDQPPLTLTGALLAPGVGGGEDAGTVVTTFDF